MSEGAGREVRLPIRLSMDDEEPMYRQIEEQLKGLILSGRLRPGTPLPSIRALARELSCSVITTRRAYQDLESAGFIRTRQGMRATVADVGEEERERYRREAVLEALRAAVEAGRQRGLSAEELRRMFEETLSGLERKE